MSVGQKCEWESIDEVRPNWRLKEGGNLCHMWKQLTLAVFEIFTICEENGIVKVMAKQWFAKRCRWETQLISGREDLIIYVSVRSSSYPNRSRYLRTDERYKICFWRSTNSLPNLDPTRYPYPVCQTYIRHLVHIQFVKLRSDAMVSQTQSDVMSIFRSFVICQGDPSHELTLVRSGHLQWRILYPHKLLRIACRS